MRRGSLLKTKPERPWGSSNRSDLPTRNRPIITRRRDCTEIALPSGTTLSELSKRPVPYVVLEGFCAEFVKESDRRRILGLKLPGEIIAIEAYFGQCPGCEATALGEAKIAPLSDALNDLGHYRFISEMLAVQALRALSIARLWTFRLTALDAPRRISHLLCEMRHRLSVNGEIPRVLRTPLTQSDIADMCGITPIHANRALARIRENGLGEMRRGDFYAADWSSLEDYAQFDTAAFGSALCKAACPTDGYVAPEKPASRAD